LASRGGVQNEVENPGDGVQNEVEVLLRTLEKSKCNFVDK
jgi:hypothetical protein